MIQAFLEGGIRGNDCDVEVCLVRVKRKRVGSVIVGLRRRAILSGLPVSGHPHADGQGAIDGFIFNAREYQSIHAAAPLQGGSPPKGLHCQTLLPRPCIPEHNLPGARRWIHQLRILLLAS